MGREIRRVPKDWEHPIGAYERPQPMYDRPFAPAMREWYERWQAWERGERPEGSEGHEFWEWDGPPPDPNYYRPDWPEESRTHLMMYEDTSEGTPISPAFETPEEVARWCADNGASLFAGQTATYEEWLRIARGGYAITQMFPATGEIRTTAMEPRA